VVVDAIEVEVEVEAVDVVVVNVVVVDDSMVVGGVVVVVEMTVAVEPQEQAELYFEGLEPHAAVNRGMNPVVAVNTPCV
jgi:hypothetical protein